jgi:hypothetical protein
MTKSLIFISYFLGSITFAVAGSSVGMGMGIGFIFRGDFSSFAVKSTVLGLLGVTCLYALHRFISAKTDKKFYLYRKRGEQVGTVVFLGLFIYFVIFSNN